jgi:hypothetical protein
MRGLDWRDPIGKPGQGSRIRLLGASITAAREDLPHICVRICGTLNIIEGFVGG